MIFLKYKDPDIEKAYQLWKRPAQLKQVALITFITASLYLAMSFLDYVIAPQEVQFHMFILHLAIVPFLLYSITFLALKNKFYLLMVAFLIIASIFATIGHTIIMVKLNYYSSYYPEVYLIIFWVFTVSGLSIRPATYTSLSIIAISGVGALYIDMLGIYNFIMHFFWMISSFSFGFAGAFLLESSNRTVFSKRTELQQELNNKNILLKELTHRVKNNLQIVSGILFSQSRKVDSEKTKKIFQESIQTIQAMGMIHESLFTSKNLDSIDFKEYIDKLTKLTSQNIQNKNVKFTFNSQSVIISIEYAVPLGLVLNEIITNSLKYASPKDNEDILIKIAMTMDENKEINLHVSDNGQGIDFEKHKEGFGTQLIQSLINYEIKGEIETFNNNGLNYKIKFKQELTD